MSGSVEDRSGTLSALKFLSINTEKILEQLDNAEGANQMDCYISACARVQFWADLVTAGKLYGLEDGSRIPDLERTLCLAERRADAFADNLIGTKATVPKHKRCPSTVKVSLSHKTSSEVLGKLLHLPMPECCGYDVADLKLIVDDVQRFAKKIDINRNVVIVGIRTGGTYLAPIWRAALTQIGVVNVRWCTVRPLEGVSAAEFMYPVLKWITRAAASLVVIVDDRPDTGATMDQVADPLRSYNVDIWCACVGSVWRDQLPCKAHQRELLNIDLNNRSRRVWECLLDSDHPELLSRLCCVHGLITIPSKSHVHFRCPQGEHLYGMSKPWFPWNDTQVLQGTRSLVNPHKTPVDIIGPDGIPLLHLRFIGNDIFGLSEFQRVRKTGRHGPAWFLDGYAITANIPLLQPFQELYHIASSDERLELLSQVASWLSVPECQVAGRIFQSPVIQPTLSRWLAIGEAMQLRCGSSYLDKIHDQLNLLAIQRVPWPGFSGKLFRSSLKYSSGGWHWQVDSHRNVYRFQREANWGGVSFPELELAVFVLENRLPIEDSNVLATLCGLSWLSVRHALSLAALMIAESRVRSVKRVSQAGRIKLSEDFHRLIDDAVYLGEM